MKRIYVCSICGYEYDEMMGDPENGIDRGMEFDDVPCAWTCPVCAADKSEFELYETENEEEG